MLMQQQRRRRILDIMQDTQSVRVQDLVELFSVSTETIRRDLEELEGEGCLRRVYGGAVANDYYKTEPSYENRESAHSERKRSIAREAVRRVEDGDTVFLDVGTTVREAARLLVDKKNLTVITNSLPIAMMLSDNESFHVVSLGGETRPGEHASSGSEALAQLGKFRADKHLMGVGGIAAEVGITDYHTEEAAIRRKMIAHAGMTIALTDSSKFGVVAPNAICKLSEIDCLITDSALPAKFAVELKKCGLTIVAVEVPTNEFCE